VAGGGGIIGMESKTLVNPGFLSYIRVIHREQTRKTLQKSSMISAGSGT
jgi:hypothetical protein